MPEACSAASALPPPPSRSLISVLRDDELLSVFAFVAFGELPGVLRCCRAWLVCARKERCRVVTMRSLRLQLVPQLTTSMLARRHVSSVSLLRPTLFGRADANPTLHTLRALQTMPHLTALRDIDIQGEAAKLLRTKSMDEARQQLSQAWPAKLRELFILLRIAPSESRALILSSLPPLHATLTDLALEYDDRSELDLTPLLQLDRLHTLALSLPPTAAQRAVLQRVSSLRQLIVNGGGGWQDVSSLVQLCTPPHQLQLNRFNLLGTRLDDRAVRALTHLPTLTSLHAELPPSSWPLLDHFPRLTFLHLDNRSDATSEEAEALPQALRTAGHSSLRELDVQLAFGPDAEWWQRLLQSVPGLRSLTVRSTRAAGLLPLLAVHVPQLERITVMRAEVRPDEVDALAHPTLLFLSLQWCGLLLAQAQRDAMVRSVRLPRLADCTVWPTANHLQK